MNGMELFGWDRLRHGGLLLDPQRLREIANYQPTPLSAYSERELRRLSISVLDGSGDIPGFISFVLQTVCNFNETEGSWVRGTSMPSEWGKVAVTGETVKPRQLWTSKVGGLLPVFIDKEPRIGLGRGRRLVSQVLQWLRSSNLKLAIVTNGRQWRMVFAGLDFDAWCEWDLDLWLEEGVLSPQVTALRTLLSPALWTPVAKDGPLILLQAILDSRKGQAELSAVLGERVREAVELLVQGHGEALRESCSNVEPEDIYRAAVRMVMRMVVVLFAESRDLLPRENALYHSTYGITGLLEDLEKIAARGGNRLSRQWSGWPRMLALFRLVYQGSHHPDLLVPAYGGELFAPGDSASPDGLLRALAVFETSCYDREMLADREVYKIIEHITRTKIKVRQGRSSTWVPAPVDFSDLSSEYIGILYEGLLDFELKTAPAGDPVVFLAVGNQPALPLSRLEAMDDAALKNLLENMKDTSSKDEEEAGEEEETSEETPEVEAAEEGDEAEPEPQEIAEEPGDERHTTRTRAEIWARRAVDAGKLVTKPRGTLTPEKRLKYEQAVASKARQLVTKVILPGEWYLVRWGGTRKGSGSFYTRPGLAVPTVHRTLRPLAYNPPTGANGKPDRDAPAAKWTPKKPEEILALKVCDPGCGSGSFDVAALRFLTDAVYDALHYHGRLAGDAGRPLDEILGLIAPGTANDDSKAMRLPRRPEDEDFEKKTKAVLRRYVVERCIYGVDLDPLAVELCRLALWVETMDKTLPFSFLDHKVKCGNSLVGAWFDQFQHYPAMAWKNRDGGDSGHTNGVHFKADERTRAIKSFVNNKLKPNLIDAITGQVQIFSPEASTLQDVHDKALKLLKRLHDMPVHDTAERSRIYRDELLGSPEYQALKNAMDLWCACWFWPPDKLEVAPVPTTFAHPMDETCAVAASLAADKRFFHWELEFPDVFSSALSGFDAVLGNPPWDIAKPSSKEFFSNIDPLYRSYGKQEALRWQTSYFENADVERSWLDYSADFRSQSNFVGYCANAFGDPDLNEQSSDRFSMKRGNANLVLHAVWRKAREKSVGYADPAHSFCHQGSADVNLYKLFLEQAYSILRSGGRLGFVVPFGLCCDDGCTILRSLFLDRCSWEWLFGFENREGIFQIDPRNKFNPIIIEKGGRTEEIRAAFMRRKLEEWELAESYVTQYSRTQFEHFSPNSKAFLEIQSPRDLELLDKIYANAVLLDYDSPDGWGIKYSSEFHMTSDASLFPTRPKWEALGYRPDEYSRWIKAQWNERSETSPAPVDRKRSAIDSGIILSADRLDWTYEASIEQTDFLRADKGGVISGPAVALPLYQGPMVFDYSPNAAIYSRGGNSGAVWIRTQDPSVMIEPQYLMGLPTYLSSGAVKSYKVVYRTLSGPMSNERSAIPACIQSYPCGNSLGVIVSQFCDVKTMSVLSALVGSYVFDWVLRMRLSSMNINAFYLKEMCVPRLSTELLEVLSLPCAQLSYPGYRYSVEWLHFQDIVSPARIFALTEHERLRIRVTTAAITYALWGLSLTDLPTLLALCDLPTTVSARRDAVRNISSKGLWRVGRLQDPEIRATVLSVPAMHNLESKIQENGNDIWEGIRSFLAQNHGEGWMLPETLRLADYGLGHDERAKEHQPVASRLGPRFYDWQLAQSPEESWRECHLHARNLLGEEGYNKLLEEIEAEKRGEKSLIVSESQTPYKQDTGQEKLFE